MDMIYLLRIKFWS